MTSSLLSMPESQILDSGRGQVCVCANMSARGCQFLERVWVQMGLFCAYLSHVAK